MTSKNYGQIGVGSIVEFGKVGPQLKNNSSIFEHRNNADDDFVIARGAHPISPEVLEEIGQELHVWTPSPSPSGRPSRDGAGCGPGARPAGRG